MTTLETALLDNIETAVGDLSDAVERYRLANPMGGKARRRGREHAVKQQATAAALLDLASYSVEPTSPAANTLKGFSARLKDLEESIADARRTEKNWGVAKLVAAFALAAFVGHTIREIVRATPWQENREFAINLIALESTPRVGDCELRVKLERDKLSGFPQRGDIQVSQKDRSIFTSMSVYLAATTARKMVTDTDLEFSYVWSDKVDRTVLHLVRDSDTPVSQVMEEPPTPPPIYRLSIGRCSDYPRHGPVADKYGMLEQCAKTPEWIHCRMSDAKRRDLVEARNAEALSRWNDEGPKP